LMAHSLPRWRSTLRAGTHARLMPTPPAAPRQAHAERNVAPAATKRRRQALRVPPPRRGARADTSCR
jgi:hypothetical protein